MSATVPASNEVDSKGLKGGALGLLSSVVVGVASTAPAYSLAASLGFIVASGGALLAGVKAPGIVLLAFIPMYLIAVAYQELNKAEPDCGTTFTWATRAFGPITGWMGGWGIIVADVIVMANLAQVAGSYSFTFIGGLGFPGVADLSNNVFWSTVAGLLWIAIMTWICYRGIEISARMQYVLLSIEIIVLIAFAAFALIRVYTGTAETYSIVPTLDWFNPFTLDFGSVIAPAMLTAIFIYWGWDTAVSVNEETADPAKTPGRAAIISTVLLLVTYALVAVAAVSFAGVGTKGIGLGNETNASDVFSAIGPQLFGDSVLGHILLLLLAASILTSASASTQTTILPTARTALSMAVYKAIPTRFARIHPKFLTPTWSTIGMGIVSAAFYLIFTLISTNLLSALIGSIGLMIAFYYGLTGFACVFVLPQDAHLLVPSLRDAWPVSVARRRHAARRVRLRVHPVRGPGLARRRQRQERHHLRVRRPGRGRSRRTRDRCGAHAHLVVAPARLLPRKDTAEALGRPRARRRRRAGAGVRSARLRHHGRVDRPRPLESSTRADGRGRRHRRGAGPGAG